MDKPVIPISVITTVYNEGRTILRFLESWRAQSVEADELIILDGGSTDGTADIIRAFSSRHRQTRIRLIIDPTCSKKYAKGPIARGRNVAIRNARNSLIAATDAGCILHPRWLEKICQPFDDPRTDVVAGWYDAVTDNAFQKRYAQIYTPRLTEVEPDTFLPSSRSIAFQKSCWDAVGGYPEGTYTAEDTMFDLSLKAAGFTFVFAPEAVVSWVCPASPEEARKKHYNYGFGDGQYRIFKKNYLSLLFGLVFPINYFDRKKYRGFWREAYSINLSAVRGYLMGLLESLRSSDGTVRTRR